MIGVQLCVQLTAAARALVGLWEFELAAGRS